MRLIAGLLLALSAALPAHAAGERAGQFDYYVLSLSWSPNWCAATGDARHAPECAPGRRLGFVLHGLWPQNLRGYPSFCRTSQRDPSRGQSAAMADITGSAGLAWHEWKKHGRCSGLSAGAYFATARRAYRSIRIPEVFQRLNRDVKLPPKVVAEAFVEANPGLTPDMLAVTCNGGRIGEVRICLTKTLRPRPCGTDVARACRRPDALMDGLR